MENEIEAESMSLPTGGINRIRVSGQESTVILLEASFQIKLNPLTNPNAYLASDHGQLYQSKLIYIVDLVCFSPCT